MSSTNNIRIAKNTMMLYLRMMLLMAVSLYTSRIVLNSLGVEDYGIYNSHFGIGSTVQFHEMLHDPADERTFGQGRSLHELYDRKLRQSWIDRSLFGRAETRRIQKVPDAGIIPHSIPKLHGNANLHVLPFEI